MPIYVRNYGWPIDEDVDAAELDEQTLVEFYSFSDISSEHQLADGDFDRILIDAPCTATGILRRQPDVRLLRRQGDVAKLAATQRALLEALWPRLRPGGTLLYCTCSVLPGEGEMIVQAFRDAHADARVVEIEGDWGIATASGRQLLPTADAHDGFYYARLQRAS